MPGDQLSEVLEIVEVQGVLSGGIAAHGPWVSRAPIYDRLKFFAVARGRVWLTTDGVDAPIELAQGDVAILNGRSWLELRGGTGDGMSREVAPEINMLDAGFGDDRAFGDVGAMGDDGAMGDNGAIDDVVFGVRVDLNPAGQEVLLHAFPPVGCIRAADAAAPNLRGGLDRLLDEVSGNRMGSAFAIRHHAELLLLDVLRAWLTHAELPPGWLRLLSDERLRPALRLIHAEPARRWGLEELARSVAMSRTSFAERFRITAGMPPVSYLNSWRMLLAQRALRDRDVSIAVLAAELGYASASAFSTAFKRQVGEAPLRYVRRQHGLSPLSVDAQPA
jgi:AraC-like DNA-binding protein